MSGSLTRGLDLTISNLRNLTSVDLLGVWYILDSLLLLVNALSILNSLNRWRLRLGVLNV